MKTIKDLNEKLLWEVKEKEEKEETASKLKSKEFRDTLQTYSGRVSGTSDVKVDYRELKKELESKLKGINWTMMNVKKTFEVITKMIGVQPEDDK